MMSPAYVMPQAALRYNSSLSEAKGNSSSVEVQRRLRAFEKAALRLEAVEGSLPMQLEAARESRCIALGECLRCTSLPYLKRESFHRLLILMLACAYLHFSL